MSDVVWISGVQKSTVSRLWDDPNWLDVASGRTVQAMCRSIIGVERYFSHLTLTQATELAVDELNQAAGRGEEIINPDDLNSMIPPQLTIRALTALAHVARGNTRESIHLLGRFWGCDVDEAFRNVWKLVAPKLEYPSLNCLSERSAAVFEHIFLDRNPSYHALMAKALFLHHSSPEEQIKFLESNLENVSRRTVLPIRSALTGLLLKTESGEEIVDYLRIYRKRMREFKAFQSLERWAYPTYFGDATITHDFQISSITPIEKSVSAILRSIQGCGNESSAYRYYVSMVGVPALLSIDPTFNGEIGKLVECLNVAGEKVDSKELVDLAGMLTLRN
ncbi:hypothetical protein [Rhodococcus qingshengii]|uniref:hypothetical protein n=1 Tax=Rhodococcus qingshengii TaxID=334542 RepID=UPI001BEAD70B|nr:hypothetical protein [Rhodococcus qingshengii]MBT2275880.1 hypothetical protein [Rhodococcus qingshengii]